MQFLCEISEEAWSQAEQGKKMAGRMLRQIKLIFLLMQPTFFLSLK